MCQLSINKLSPSFAFQFSDRLPQIHSIPTVHGEEAEVMGQLIEETRLIV